MVRSKTFFTIGSIVSMVVMLVSLSLGFVEDSYYYSSSMYKYYYYSFAEMHSEFYIPFLSLVFVYIAFGILATVLYKKRIKAINIMNLVSTSIVCVAAFLVSCYAIGDRCETFGWFLLLGTLCVIFPLNITVEIFALVAQKHKVTLNPHEDASTTSSNSNTIAIGMLKQLKELRDAGVITEEEYNEKRQQYVKKI